MWAGPSSKHGGLQWFTLHSRFDNKIFCDFTRPVFLLPATPEAYDAMVKQGAIVVYKANDPEGAKRFPNLVGRQHRHAVIAFLASIGLVRPAPQAQTKGGAK